MTGLLWLASYPKSGNTWMRLALGSLRRGGGVTDLNDSDPAWDGTSYSRARFDDALDVDSSDLTEAEILRAQPALHRAMAAGLTEPALRKAHEACLRLPDGRPLFPPEATAGAVYLVRDPRDVAPSLASHMGLAVDRVIAMMNDPEAAMSRSRRRLSLHLRQPLLSWSRHVESWLDHAPFPVTLIRYEDMLADPAREIGRAAAAFGIAAGDAALAGAVAATRFDTLRTQEENGGFRERPPQGARFFRRGRAGDWRDSLTTPQAARIEADHAAVMTRLGYL